MASTPKIRIYDEFNDSIQETWNAGVLDIGSGESFESSEKVINVWNNRGGNDTVPDLIGCNITTKNINGDDLYEQVVTDRWVQVCVDSMASVDSGGQKIFSPIGKDAACWIAHQDATGDDKTDHVIKGTANNGNPDDSKDNYSMITMKVVPDLNAEIKTHYFKTRISGYYI